MSRHPMIAGHRCHHCMYDSLIQAFYWHYMAADVSHVVLNCSSCARNSSKYHHGRYMQLFAASGPSELIAIDIAEPFPKTGQDSLYVLIVTNRSSVSMWAVPTSGMTNKHNASHVIDYWIMSYCILLIILAENKTRFVIKFFTKKCALLSVEHQTTTMYQPWTNDQSERLNKTVHTRLRH